MQKKYLIFILALFVLAGFFWLYSNLFRTDGADSNSSPENDKVTATNEPNNQFAGDGHEQEELEPDQIADYLKEMTDEEKKSRPVGWSDEKWLRFVFNHRTRLNEDGPVKFYGKIVDQNDLPVEGVLIDAEILYHEPAMDEILKENTSNRKKTIVLTSDADGQFSIDFTRGKSLTLKGYKKEGYQLEGRKYFVYDFGPRMSSPHNPDPSNPVVFKLVPNP